MRLLGLVAALCGAVAGCSSSPKVQNQDPGPPVQGGDGGVQPQILLRDLAVSTGTLIPTFDPHVGEYTLTANSAMFPIDVTASADGPLTINGQAATSDVASTITLAPKQDIVVTVGSPGGATRAYTVHFMPSTFPEYTVAASDPAKAGNERILLTPDAEWLFVTDRTGAPLYYRVFPPSVVTDFKRHVVPGGVLYSYNQTTQNLQQGRVHVLDDHMREQATLQLLPNRGHGALDADLHDFLVLGPEHYVLEAYWKKVMDLSSIDPTWSTNVQVVVAVIQEVDHGNVIFEWDSTDAPSLFKDSVEGNKFTVASLEGQDYVHLNSVAIDPKDGNFLVSLRYTDSILKLDRTTGATIWTLGGKSDSFGLTPEQRFSHQHDAKRLDDGTILVFDNGNNAHATRTIALQLDEASKTVTSFQSVYERPDDQPDSTFMGSIHRMSPSRYLIGWGGRDALGATWPAVTEIVDGAPVWSLTFTSQKVFSYRAVPIPGP